MKVMLHSLICNGETKVKTLKNILITIKTHLMNLKRIS